MSYIEGFITPVPTANKDEYLRHATSAVPLFDKLGATRVVECWGDDIADGKVTDFKRAVKAKDDETVVFSWIEYPDRATRDAANARMREDPDVMASLASIPFDGRRMVYSGFVPILQAGPDTGAGYIDGYVVPVTTADKAAYQKLAEASAPIFMEHGAVAVVENWGDDLIKGEVTDFYKAVEAKEGETVAFSWVAWPSKAARDAGNKATFEDERFKPGAPAGQPGSMAMPFDGKRMIIGGFVPILGQ